MLLEGLKLMIVGMASVMLFLLLLIACIELVKFLTRNFTMKQEQSLLQSHKSDSNKYKTVSRLEVPVKYLLLQLHLMSQIIILHNQFIRII